MKCDWLHSFDKVKSKLKYENIIYFETSKTP